MTTSSYRAASKKTDWEVELAVVIGKGGSYIDEARRLLARRRLRRLS